MNHKLSLIYLSVLLFASCSVEPINESANDGLSFNVVLESNPVTKAESMRLYSDESKTTAFTLERVPETKSVQINQGSTFTQIYESFQVEGRENGSRKFYDYAQYNSDTGLWDLQNSSYQWRPGHEIEIIAAASGRNNEQFFNGITYNGNPSTASFNYSLPDTHASQQDYLIGYYKGEIANGTVSLKFNHPLTSLVFRVGPLPLGVSLQVNSITLEGIDAEAICDVTFGENTTYTWRDHSGTKDYTQVIENAAPQEEGDDILDETTSFIVIPRTFPANSEARILLNITENGREYEMYASLAGQVWNPGETNIYQLSYHGERKPILCNGLAFNDALAAISGGSSTVEESDGISVNSYRKIPNIKKIVFQVRSDVNTGTLVNASGEKPIYMNYNSSTQTVTVSSDDFTIYVNEASSYMFRGLVNLTSIEGMENLNTRNMKSMLDFFFMCKSLTSIDLQSFDTSNVTNLGRTFDGCWSLTSLDLSSFNADNVLTTWATFRGARMLRNIKWGDHFQMPNCEATQQMFSGCSSLTNLDLSFMTTPNNTNMQSMFNRCEYLKSVNIENMNVDNVALIMSLFYGCIRLESINLGQSTFPSVTTKTNALYNTASYLNQKCTITCTQEAKNVLTTGDTGYNASRFEWHIITATP